MGVACVGHVPSVVVKTFAVLLLVLLEQALPIGEFVKCLDCSLDAFYPADQLLLAFRRSPVEGRECERRGPGDGGGDGGVRKERGSGRRLKPAPNVVTLGLASNTPRRRPLNKAVGYLERPEPSA